MLEFRKVILVLIASLPFLYMSLRSKSINLDRKFRGHQFILPVIGIVYCIPTTILIGKIEQWVIRLVTVLIAVTRMIPGVGLFISKFLTNWLSLFKIGFGIQLLCNTLLMTGFCLLKRILLPVIKRFWSRWKWLYEQTSGNFYTELGRYSVLLQRYAHLRIFMNVMYYTLVVIGFCDCMLAFIYSSHPVFHFPFYPVFGIIIVGEISFFLNGLTFDEGNFIEDIPRGGLIPVNYSELMEELRETFPDRVNLTGEFPKAVTGKRVRDWEEELALGDNLDRISGAYFSAISKSGESVKADYVAASNKLLHKKSVLIHNPFYHDFTTYLLLPVFHELLDHHKCLIVCGRSSDETDICSWIQTGISQTTNLPKLWNIGRLGKSRMDSELIDIGVLGFSNLYNLDTLHNNEEFFNKTSFIILLEPSNLLGTGQIGLRTILELCEGDHKTLTYCVLDRTADGLVDALSHMTRKSITEVVAAPMSENPYCSIFWKGEGPGVQNRILPRISHYLGIGTEIAALAMHRGVDNIHWYSGSKMPLTDLKWNVEQYYPSICSYIHSPKEQSELDVRFQFHEDLWQSEIMDDAFILVEDEFSNVFEMGRTFAARIGNRGFVNILSESYLLRDYMCENRELLLNDPKAIPSIVPDYARTERNLVIRMIMMMSVMPVDESTLSKELALHGCEARFPYMRFCELLNKHTGIDELGGERTNIKKTLKEEYVGEQVISKIAYSVDRSFAENIFESSLKSAYFIVENEEMDRYPMGNRLMGHIEQVLLPGQFFCYEGKYYQVRAITYKNGIIVRRSSDHIFGRIYYRQLRDYYLDIKASEDDVRNMRGIRLQMCFANIKVETDGYLEMKARNMLSDASYVALEKNRTRNLNYKSLLKIDLPDASSKILYTLSILFNEIFNTLYPNETGYLVATTKYVPDNLVDHSDYKSKIRSLVPSLSVIGDDASEQAIYVIEDSNIDLGIIVSIERNFQRIMEIIADYIDWYVDYLKNKEESDSIVGLGINHDKVNYNDAAISDVDGEDEEQIRNPGVTKSDNLDWLDKRPFLNYGFIENIDWLDLDATLEFLKTRGFLDSNIHRSRKHTPTFDEGSDYDPSQPGVHYCDFCGAPLETGKYDILKDGRERCPVCSSSAVKKRKQFKQVYTQTLEEMERIFHISINEKIKVRMVNAKKVNDLPGVSFVPTPRQDSRVLGYAQKSREGYTIKVENGAPLWNMKSTLVHELTHIWQYINWNDEKVGERYPSEEKRLVAYEGMAVWTEVQYLLAMGEKERAIMYKRSRDIDTSVYGIGMKEYLSKYPALEESSIRLEKSPFGKFPPL